MTIDEAKALVERFKMTPVRRSGLDGYHYVVEVDADMAQAAFALARWAVEAHENIKAWSARLQRVHLIMAREMDAFNRRLP